MKALTVHEKLRRLVHMATYGALYIYSNNHRDGFIDDLNRATFVSDNIVVTLEQFELLRQYDPILLKKKNNAK